jgi:hypothetical protein
VSSTSQKYSLDGAILRAMARPKRYFTPTAGRRVEHATRV